MQDTFAGRVGRSPCLNTLQDTKSVVKSASQGSLADLAGSPGSPAPGTSTEPNEPEISIAWEHQDHARRLTRQARDEFGAFLSRPQWDWFVTHTFGAQYVSPKEGDRHYFAWLSSLVLAARVRGFERPFWFRGTEYQDRGTLHYHSLIGGVGDIRRLLFKDFWELHGFARVEKYEPGKGANFYVGKYLTKTEADIKFSHNLKRELERTSGSVSGTPALAVSG